MSSSRSCARWAIASCRASSSALRSLFRHGPIQPCSSSRCPPRARRGASAGRHPNRRSSGQARLLIVLDRSRGGAGWSTDEDRTRGGRWRRRLQTPDRGIAGGPRLVRGRACAHAACERRPADMGIGRPVRRRGLPPARSPAHHGVTHVFYTARAKHGETGVESVPDNVAMLRNVLDAIEPVAARLEHVHLVQGTKYYGMHLGPFRTPAREDDVRLDFPNFYYDQQDLLAERQRGRDWAWSASRPTFIYDFAPERARNGIAVVGAYAAICRELGEPFDFFGSEAAFSAVRDFTDASLLARAMAFIATTPGMSQRGLQRGQWRHEPLARPVARAGRALWRCARRGSAVQVHRLDRRQATGLGRHRAAVMVSFLHRSTMLPTGLSRTSTGCRATMWCPIRPNCGRPASPRLSIAKK